MTIRIVLMGGPLDGEVVPLGTDYDEDYGCPPYYDRFIEVMTPVTAGTEGDWEDVASIERTRYAVGNWHRWTRKFGPVNEPVQYMYEGVLEQPF